MKYYNFRYLNDKNREEKKNNKKQQRKWKIFHKF